MSQAQRAPRVLAELSARGMLLVQDRHLPSVVGILTGESLRTSWWSHPKARLIFSMLGELADHRDVLFAKLLAGKDTLIHRRLWPSLLAVATARQPWQVGGLSKPARALLAQIERGDAPVRAAGPPARELQRRLLATAREVHTESGRHELAFESWAAWARRVRCSARRSIPLARQALERATVRLGASLTALPWPVDLPSDTSRASRGA